MRIKFFIILLFLLCILSHSYSQRIDTLINEHEASRPVERLYLQFDKAIYIPGETIWFKAYILSVLAPDEESKNLYVDFRDKAGKIISHTVFPIISGMSRGQFTLPTNLPASIIQVTAYTKWMLNFDSAFVFTKTLVLLDTKSRHSKEKHIEPKINLYFFPEGGDAVTNLTTRIAFMAKDQLGLPANISGEVKDNTGAKISDLHVQHDGMGSFHFIPEAGKKYSAFWKDQNGNESVTDLPEIKSLGIALTINSIGNTKTFSIQRMEDSQIETKDLHIIAIMYQQVVYMSNILLENRTMTTGNIPTKGLPSGIMQVAVLNKNWIPLAERIVYVKNPADTFHTNLTFSKLNFEKKGLNELVINNKDSLPASFSISITDARIEPSANTNIISHLLLSSQLKGQIFNPAYYFSDTASNCDNDLDLVMLTHGWRRYKWEDIIHKKPDSIAYPYDSAYISFSGKVTGLKDKQLASSVKLLGILKSDSLNKGNMFYVDLDANGNFKFPGMILFDTLLMTYKLIGNKLLGNVNIEVMNDQLKTLPSGSINNIDIHNAKEYDSASLSKAESLYNKYKGIYSDTNKFTLKEVIVYAKKKSPLEKLDSLYTSQLFKGDDAQIFDLRNDPRAHSVTNVFAYLEGKVSGLLISGAGGMDGTPITTRHGLITTFFVDEIPVDPKEISRVLDLNMFDIAMIKIFEPPFVGAPGNGPGGAVAIYTKRADDKSVSNKAAEIAYKKIIGYTAIREFYSPNYSDSNSPEFKPDTRTTLYWNSYINTLPKENNVKLTFYNNDYTKSFRIVLEGMNSSGQLSHFEKVFE